MEELFRVLPGVTQTQVGFSGGHIPNVAYREVTTGTTGHAETLMVEFDADRISLRDLLIEFFRVHNPTKLNQQGNDIGTQYRSVIFIRMLIKRQRLKRSLSWWMALGYGVLRSSQRLSHSKLFIRQKKSTRNIL